VDVVECIVVPSSNDRKRRDEHDWYKDDTRECACRENEPAIDPELFHLFPGVERIIGVEGGKHGLERGTGDPGGKKRLDDCVSMGLERESVSLSCVRNRASHVSAQMRAAYRQARCGRVAVLMLALRMRWG
jgi:hypothetical protein